MNLKAEIEKELEYCNARLQYIEKLIDNSPIINIAKSDIDKDYINLKRLKINLLRMLTDLEIHSKEVSNDKRAN